MSAPWQKTWPCYGDGFARGRYWPAVTCAALALSGCESLSECRPKPEMIPGEFVLTWPMKKSELMTVVDGGRLSLICKFRE
jgi:hypothetical protein